jgi:hypothetical protein
MRGGMTPDTTATTTMTSKMIRITVMTMHTFFCWSSSLVMMIRR